MILTSYYKGLDLVKHKDQVISISGDRGRGEKFTGEYYQPLAPKKDFWEIWHDNIGKISPAENTKYYIREYYEQVLSKLDVNKVYEELDNKILLCYEDPRAFCHRQIVAAWFELYLGLEVPEVEDGKEGNLVVKTNREFIKDYLEEVITSRVDMRGFNTLYALNLYNKAEALEAKAQTNYDLEIAKQLEELAFGEANIKRNTLK